MYCVIQEIQRKKPNAYGHEREIETYSYEINGKRKYSYRHTGGRFERPILTAYKISIHESKRLGGVVTKKQYPVTTIGYYDLAEYGLWDCIKPGKVEAIAATMDEPEDHLWDTLYAKVDPLQERIQAEFAKTPERKVKARHDKLLKTYQSKKQAFAKRWGVDADTYDYCYDVFGNVINQAYLDGVIEAGKQQEQARRSYQKTGSSTYSGYDYSRLFGTASSAYSADDRGHLKKFYKALSKIYHPDMNPGADTQAEMVLLNRLKEDWGI